jgi:hypothetical protein
VTKYLSEKDATVLAEDIGVMLENGLKDIDLEAPESLKGSLLLGRVLLRYAADVRDSAGLTFVTSARGVEISLEPKDG